MEQLLNKYRVYYKKEKTLIEFGEIEATSRFEALEHIILNDEVRVNLLDLSERYDGMNSDIIVKNNNYGITYHYEDGSEEFISILGDLTDVKENPASFKLNFDQETLSSWITTCTTKLPPKEGNT